MSKYYLVLFPGNSEIPGMRTLQKWSISNWNVTQEFDFLKSHCCTLTLIKIGYFGFKLKVLAEIEQSILLPPYLKTPQMINWVKNPSIGSPGSFGRILVFYELPYYPANKPALFNFFFSKSRLISGVGLFPGSAYFKFFFQLITESASSIMSKSSYFTS